MQGDIRATKLEHRVWEGFLVGYRMDRKSFRIFYPTTKSERERRSVIFMQMPAVMPEPGVVSGFHDREFTYDDYDDCFETCETTLSTKTSVFVLLTKSSDYLYLRELLEHIRETRDRGL